MRPLLATMLGMMLVLLHHVVLAGSPPAPSSRSSIATTSTSTTPPSSRKTWQSDGCCRTAWWIKDRGVGQLMGAMARVFALAPRMDWWGWASLSARWMMNEGPRTS